MKKKKGMQTIDIQNIVSNSSLNKKEVAEHLFPKNRYPSLALNRVMSGEAFLDANQISKLSLLSGIPIGALYSDKGWTNKILEGKVIFTNGKFKAELNTKTWTTLVFDKDSLFHEFVLHKETVLLKDYIELLNAEINKKQ